MLNYCDTKSIRPAHGPNPAIRPIIKGDRAASFKMAAGDGRLMDKWRTAKRGSTILIDDITSFAEDDDLCFDQTMETWLLGITVPGYRGSAECLY